MYDKMLQIAASMQLEHNNHYLCHFVHVPSIYKTPLTLPSPSNSYTSYKTSHVQALFVKHLITPYKLSFLTLCIFTLFLHCCTYTVLCNNLSFVQNLHCFVVFYYHFHFLFWSLIQTYLILCLFHVRMLVTSPMHLRKCSPGAHWLESNDFFYQLN